jgi:glycosyltransferase involved in cell wall biosynthesis
VRFKFTEANEQSSEKNMKIVYCINGTYNSGGMERVLANKANYLAKQGCDIIIITTDQKNRKPFFPLSSPIQCYDLDINYAENNNKGFINKVLHYPFKQCKHKKRLTKLLNHLQADIVISMFDNDVSFISKIKDGSKKVLEVHFSRFKRLQYGRKGIWKWVDALRNKADLKQVKTFDKFVVLTEEDKEYWGDLPNMEVIPNARSFNPVETSLLNEKKVIAIGRYDYQKGFEYLIDAWTIVHPGHPEWKLDIIGDGPLRTSFQRRINDNHLGDCVHLEYPTSHIEEKYLHASILTLSSRYEGLPMVLLEGQAFGLPIVSFACKCGPKDIITPGEDGFLVPEGNVSELADRIIQLIENDELRKKMGQKAKINSERFAEQVIMAQWDRLFNNLLSKNHENHCDISG